MAAKRAAGVVLGAPRSIPDDIVALLRHDDVEAALDDRNLGRLLEALEGLRQSSQFIVITHQKRTHGDR